MTKEIKTIATLKKFVEKEILKIYTVEDIEEDGIIELINKETYSIIENFANNNYEISDREYRVMTCKNYGEYSYCDDKKELKTNILITVLEYLLTNEKKTFKQVIKASIEYSNS